MDRRDGNSSQEASGGARPEETLGSVMVLAAGYGTRLGLLGAHRPKALLPVLNLPLVGYALRLAARGGVARAVVNLHYRGEDLRRHLERESYGLDVAFSPEEEILGTGGGVKRALGLLGSRSFCVVNAKLVCDVDLKEVFRLHRSRGALATMVVRPDRDARAWGAVEVDRSGRVWRVAGLGAERVPRGVEAYMFTGIAIYEPEFFSILPEGPSCVVRQGYGPHLARGAPIYAHVHRGYWHEHSTPSRYLAGNLRLLELGRRLWDDPYLPEPGFRDETARVAPRAVLTPPVFLGAESAVASDAQVGPGVVLGSGSRVERGARLARTVVWEGVRAEGLHEEAVVTPHGVVAAPLSQEGPKTGPALGTSRR